MAIKLIHVSDIHFGSGESHGRVNPHTGLNVRFEDFVAAFRKTVDFAIENKADVFLFSGDAYKTASPEPVQQKAFAEQLKRLSLAKVPTILLVGNHDQILRGGASHSMSVFQSLEVPGVIVIQEPKLITIETQHGPLQIVGMPHVTRHLLLTQEKYSAYSATEIDKVLVKFVGAILEEMYEQLDEKIPAVATAHVMIDCARAGAEQELMIGYSSSFPLSFWLNPKLDYVALGHVHGHQVLHKEHPVVAYAGSIERVDFSEEFEDKGFVEANIERGSVFWKFHSISPRNFITIDCDLSNSVDITRDLLKQCADKISDGSVCRVRYKISQARMAELSEDDLRNQLSNALSLRLKPQFVENERPRRHPEITEKSVLQPLVALDKFLSEKYPEYKEPLLARAEKLMAESVEDEGNL